MGISKLEFKKEWEFPNESSNLTLHRADYQRILYDAALKAGAEIEFEKKVASVGQSAPSVTLEGGSIIAADLIVAADGMSSSHFQT